MENYSGGRTTRSAPLIRSYFALNKRDPSLYEWDEFIPGSQSPPPACRRKTGPQNGVSQQNCCPRGPERSASPTRSAQVTLLSGPHHTETSLATVWGGTWVWDTLEAEGQDEANDLEDRKEGLSLRCLMAEVTGPGAWLDGGR